MVFQWRQSYLIFLLTHSVSLSGIVQFGCVPRNSGQSLSNPAIAGGIVLEESDYPEIVEIRTDTTEAFQESCTGVLVAPRVLLTASHCVWVQKGDDQGSRDVLGKRRSTTGRATEDFSFEDPFEARRKRKDPFTDDRKEAEANPGARSVYFTMASIKGQSGPLVRSSCYVFPKGYGLEAGTPGTRFDISLVFLPQSFTALKYLPLPAYSENLIDSVIKQKKNVEMFGFGWDEKPFADSHKLRKGMNRIVRDVGQGDGGVIYTYSDPVVGEKIEYNQMVRDGDSGGPMLVDGKLVGIASALLRRVEKDICSEAEPQKKSCQRKQVDVGYHVDLTYEKTAHFLRSNLEKFSKGEIDPQSMKGCTPRNRSEYVKWLQTNPELL